MAELRHVEVSNRKQSKLVDEQRVMRSTVDVLSPAKTVEEKYARLWLSKFRNGSNQRQAAQATQAGYKHIQGHLSNLIGATLPELQPKVSSHSAQLQAFSKKINDLQAVEKQSLSKLKDDLSLARSEQRNSDVSSLKTQIDTVSETLEKLIELQKALESVEHTVELADVDLRAIQELGMRMAIARPDAKDLPFSLAMLANSQESTSVESGFGLSQALCSANSGSSNHVVPRTLALKNCLAAFGSQLHEFLEKDNPMPTRLQGGSRSFLAALGGALGANDEKNTIGVLNLLSRSEDRDSVHHLAATNLIAAGFNANTLALDAPSLAYKVESGLSGLKKWFITPGGRFARNPEEHIGVRLTVLSRLSEVLQHELFRNGRPVSIEHAVITPHHAIEASSLIIASLPNDLLTIHGEEVTRFITTLREFEAEVSASTKEKPLDPRSMIAFKRTLHDFHQQAGNWINERTSVGAASSLNSAREMSRDLADNGRKGFFRQATASTGDFINLAGGRFVREGWSSFQNYLGQINQKERMCQAIRSKASVVPVGQLKRNLAKLAKEEPSSSENANALINYLNGRSSSVELKGTLSPRMIIELKRTGDFLHKAWASVSKDKPAPTVIGLSSSQTSEIPGFVHTNLSQFAGSTLLSPQPSRAKPAPAAVLGDRGANAIPSRTGMAENVSNNQWVLSMWGKVLNQAGQPRAAQLLKLQKDYERAFLTNYPDSSEPPSEAELNQYHRNLSSLETISVHVASKVKDIPADVIVKMKELTPMLLEVTRGHGLATELAALNTRKLQNVSGDKNRCWLRAAWGVAVHSLSKPDFTTRVSRLGSDLTLGEIQEIYDQIKKTPQDGATENPALEKKQRNVMIAIARDQASGWSESARDTLRALEAGHDRQAEGDFGAAFLNALNLPVIIRNGNGDIPDIYLPGDFSVDQHAHPDTWPTLRYDGNGSGGHWQFYLKPVAA